ncbi:uncharacterized protein LOC113566246 [Drosophila persimilis]|uniref:uncharacterized protein LOC113566246 n=1 Tax=Drosophila persimilis TaxID=7234 RepID=UPI000F082806|nr:uncharacterized protein LOC113566246 [Drosophila persimilis]
MTNDEKMRYNDLLKIGCKADNPWLIIRRYSLRFQTKHEIWRNLLVFHVEGNFNGFSFASRCYLKLAMGQVQAVIEGGESRRAAHNEILWINGSLSRDYSKKYEVKQFSTYNWNCDSWDDYSNPFCYHNISSVDAFMIPAYSFKSGCSYIFRLLLADDDNPNRGSLNVQTITMTDYRMLQVTIECLFNCEMDFFSPFSNVRLAARCTNCETQTVRYQWYVGGQLTLTSKDLNLYIRTVANTSIVQLIVTAKDGWFGQDIKYLTKNSGPTIGKCFVKPTKGQEALTPFFPCCKNFDTKNNPIEYWYYAGHVLLDNCYDCNCEVHLPVTNFIKVLACDSFQACRTSWIKVKVTALLNVPAQPPDILWKYITNSPHNILTLPEEGLLLRYFQTIQSIASHINHIDSGLMLLRALKGIYPQTRVSLGKLANLTLTLAHRLKPIDAKEQHLLATVVKIMNNNFQRLYHNDMIYLLIEQPLFDVTQACVTVYHMMNRMCKETPLPPKSIYVQYQLALKSGKLVKGVFDKLWAEINNFDDEQDKLRSLTWLKSTWETQRLFHYLGYARQHGLKADTSGDSFYEGVALEIQCFSIERDQSYKIETSDSMHRVFFSSALLKEVKENNKDYICLKVVSIKRELNWWYPEEKQPSTILLSVRVFHYEEHFNVETVLKNSEISFTTFIGNVENESSSNMPRTTGLNSSKRLSYLGWTSIGDASTRAAIHSYDATVDSKHINCHEEGTIIKMQDVRMYRIMLEEKTMLAVRFISSTHKLQVLLKTEVQPLFSDISKSLCIVPANSRNKTFLLRNNCMQGKRAYMAVRVWEKSPLKSRLKTPVLDGPAKFDFVFEMRSCDYWLYSLPADEQHWAHDGCYPSLDFGVKKGMHCTCKILGTYTSYVYNVPAIMVPVNPYAKVELNLIILLFYLLITSFLLIWLLWFYLYRNIPISKTVVCQMVDLEDDSAREVHDLLIHVKTGGRVNAETTSSVKLSLFSTQHHEMQFTLVQDPEHLDLQRNTTYILWLRTRDIRVPTKIAVSHNNAGRFPSWYLRRIEVNDVQTQETQVFVARRWVKEKILILTSVLIFKPGDVRVVGTWKRRFRLNYEMLWTNWAMWQPITGKWRETNTFPSMSRAKRFCVFISKLVITYTICACYFRPTTPDSLQLDRAKFLNFEDLIILSVICSFVGLVMQLIFEWLIRQYV